MPDTVILWLSAGSILSDISFSMLLTPPAVFYMSLNAYFNLY